MILNNFKQQISNIINNSGLSIEAAYFVMKDIFGEIEKLYFIELQKEEQKNIDNDNNVTNEEPKN